MSKVLVKLSDNWADEPVFFQGPNGIFYVDAKERFHPIPGLLVASVPVYPYEVS